MQMFLGEQVAPLSGALIPYYQLVDGVPEPRTCSVAQLLTATALTASVTHDFGSLVDGAGESVDVTVTGAALGDFVVGVSLGVDTTDATLTADVTAANTVTVRLQNESGATLNLASTTLRVWVMPRTNIGL